MNMEEKTQKTNSPSFGYLDAFASNPDKQISKTLPRFSYPLEINHKHKEKNTKKQKKQKKIRFLIPKKNQPHFSHLPLLRIMNPQSHFILLSKFFTKHRTHKIKSLMHSPIPIPNPKTHAENNCHYHQLP